jgi:hypothetical protein
VKKFLYIFLCLFLTGCLGQLPPVEATITSYRQENDRLKTEIVRSRNALTPVSNGPAGTPTPSLPMPLFWLKYDENGPKDVSSSNSPLTNIGSPVNQQDQETQVYFGLFDQKSGYKTSNPLKNPGNFTLVARFYHDYPNNSNLLLTSLVPIDKPGPGFWLGTDGLQLWDNNGNTITTPNCRREIDFEPSRWNMLAVVYNGNTLTEYLNGQVSRSCPLAVTPVAGSQDLYIGNWPNSLPPYNNFEGKLAEVRIYALAFSQEELLTIIQP